ncbi:MAG: hypothetical protein ACPIA2_10725 [Mariniblastus sp.]
MLRWLTKSALVLSVFIGLLTSSGETKLFGQEVGVLEDFVLSSDRESVLKKMVPGTSDYYYFHALHFQNLEQYEKVDEILDKWRKRLGEQPNYRVIRNRQALLRYNSNPQETLDFLTKELNLYFAHRQRLPQAEQNFPTEFDQKLISNDRMIQSALKSSKLTGGFTERGLRLLSPSQLDAAKRRDLLKRLQYPDFPNLVELIAADLTERYSEGFGSMRIHQMLTLEQMDELAKRYPKSKTIDRFVDIYLKKLYPSEDVDWTTDPSEHRKYLERLRGFVTPLNANFNSLKACVLYRLLELDRSEGKYDLDLFVEYLKLPKSVAYINPVLLKNKKSQTIANLRANYSDRIMLPPVTDDQGLVKDYLHHFLRDAEGVSKFTPYVRETFLGQQFAMVKILNGIGDAEQWASQLSPDQYKQILERVDIEFAADNKEQFSVNDDVSLSLHLKNVPKLIVKIFEINTGNYYRTNGKEVDTDINLDGLVPNYEETFSYQSPPAIRQRREFKFPQMQKRGVYVVDFIAQGKSSRALIRKGRLHFSASVTPLGQQFTVTDESGKVVKDADLWVDGSLYEHDDDGKIMLPFSTQPGIAKAVVTQGDFSSLRPFNHVGENYQFEAAIYLDRESLTRSNKAKVLIRPSLKIVGGNPVPVSMLESPKLVVTATDLDGIATKKVIDGLELSEAVETVCEFVVPPRLSSVSLELSAALEVVSENKSRRMTVVRSYQFNGIDKSDTIEDVHLLPTESGYFLEILGKNGERRPGQPVRIKVSKSEFKNPVIADLQSDADGLVGLGRLAGVVELAVENRGSSKKKTWALGTQDQAYVQTMHVQVGEEVTLPAPAEVTKADRNFISLLEIRRNSFVKDWFDLVKVKNGLIRIADLPRGDYELRLTYPRQRSGRNYQSLKIRVVKGVEAGDMIVGEKRHLENRTSPALQISRISSNQEKIRIQLENSNKYTRVHVFVNRYQAAFNAFDEFSRVGDMEPWGYQPGNRRSVYKEGRIIGDEYQYILNRKYAMKFPGNMLERPSLILNPWEVKGTDNNAQTANAGEAFGGVGGGLGGSGARSERKDAKSETDADFANLDYLGDDSILLANLRPNENGIVAIDRDKLGPNQHLRFVAVNVFETVQRNVDFPARELAPRDARLVKALDPAQHFSQSKQMEKLLAGDTLVIEDLVSAKFQQFDDLGDAFQLMLALNPATNLAKFDFILAWSKKTPIEKQSLYSEFACHELNFFLMKKDYEFFESVILPFLKNKRERTFMDLWFLKEDLNRFAKPWEYSRLNAFEKILLSQRLEQRKDDITRNIDETYFLNPTPRSELDRLFDSSIRSRGLDEAKDRMASLANSENRPVPTASGGLGGGGFGGGGGGLEMGRGMGSGKADGRRSFLGRTRSPDVDFEAESESLNGAFDLEQDDQMDEEESGKKEKSKAGGKRQLEKQLMDKMWFNRSGDLARARSNAARLYTRVAPTMEWMENNYYELVPKAQNSALVSSNRFWRDYASHRDGVFLSPYFAESTRNFTEMMLALAVLDLPFEEPEQKFEFVNNTMTYKAAGPTIVLHQQVKDAIFDRGNSTVLVSENFFQKNDRYRYENGVRFDKFVNGDFLAHTLYGSQVVLTNPTSTPMNVELLMQIPSGSMTSSGSRETRTVLMSLEAFSTATFEYAFYFPEAGDFEHYPAHVSAKERVIAVADPVAFKVVDQPAEVDKTSWEFVSQNGTNDDVIDFLNRENILRLKLSDIAFRMKDKAFFERTIETLRARCAYDNVLWAYAVKHNDSGGIREFLSHANKLIGQCGVAFQSDLLTIDPVERNWYSHKEYSPLVNARAHQLGGTRKILNPEFASQYNRLLTVLSNRRTLTDDDQLALTYYLLLQDRIEDAMSHFGKVSKVNLDSKLQYDYCDAYLDMYRADPKSAAEKAAVWADHPVPRWANRFKQILAQVDEINGASAITVNSKDSGEVQTEMAAQAPSFDFKVESGVAKINFQNLDEMTVNLYEMDVELLFSRSPFAQDNLDGFSLIRPNFSQNIELDKKDGDAPAPVGGKRNHEFELPPKMQNKNVLVELVGGDQTRSMPYFAHSLDIQLVEKFGQLKVSEASTGKPLAKTYVKVYAKSGNGEVVFHKDGYTDLRGRFDYVSQSNTSLDGIVKFSILMMSENQGAVIRQARPPIE